MTAPSFDIRRSHGLVHLTCTCGFSTQHDTLSGALAILAAHNAWHLASDGCAIVNQKRWGLGGLLQWLWEPLT